MTMDPYKDISERFSVVGVPVFLFCVALVTVVWLPVWELSRLLERLNCPRLALALARPAVRFVRFFGGQALLAIRGPEHARAWWGQYGTPMEYRIMRLKLRALVSFLDPDNEGDQ